MRARVGTGVASTIAVLVVALAPAAAGATDAPTVLTSFDVSTGREQWHVGSSALGRGHLDPAFLSRDVVVFARRRCFSQDRTYRRGDSELVALDASDGSQRWLLRDVGRESSRSSARGDVPDWAMQVSSMPTIPVYQQRRHRLRGVSPRDGHELWNVDAARLTPRAGDARVIVLTTALGSLPGRAHATPGTVRAVDVRTGRTLWTVTYGAADRIIAVASSAEGVGVVRATGDPPTDAGLELLDGATGTRRWVVPLSAPAPAILNVTTAGNRFVVGSAFGASTYSGIDGSLLWRDPAYLMTGGPGVSAKGSRLFVPHLVFAPGNVDVDRVDALDAGSGAVVWQTPNGSGVVGTGETIAGYGQFTPDRRVLTATFATAVDGHVLWRRSVPQSGLSIGPAGVYSATGCPATNLD
jgi:outer membrane protein assembly factor BamB